MRLLESAPERYDRGIRLLTLGGLEPAYERLLDWLPAGHPRVLDIGCGTGTLSLAAARRGARVKGIDIDPQMLEIARSKVRAAGLEGQVELEELGVAELDRERERSYDAVTCGLSLSELGPDELSYALEQIHRLLRPGGLLLVADEIRPRNPALRLLHALIRIPLVGLTWLLTQQTTHPVTGLPDRIEAAGFTILSLRESRLGSFLELVARRP
ncbi:MAG: class I SAM-dependent methyltransferase [Gammaproteobacteria bacterium]|nr:MAG: class I SAM-dependent methyltransferase [Gammaproteobacteria bacterium]